MKTSLPLLALGCGITTSSITSPKGHYDDDFCDRLGFTHSLIDLGYYTPVSKNSSVYAILGAEKLSAEFDLSNPLFSDITTTYSDTAFTAEIGGKFNLTKGWTAEPAIHIATFEEPLYELPAWL